MLYVKKHSIIILYVLVLGLLAASGYWGGKAISAVNQSLPLHNRTCIIIDAGHGGVDGGAVSCTGVYESKINLDIALRLNDLFHLLGYDTKMIRTTDISVYTYGESIGAKKASDLKERVRIVNETQNSILLSIHQNYFSDGRYSGAQMFYANAGDSKNLAKLLQSGFSETVNKGSDRQAKRAEGIYLMKHIKKTGVLIECGFLSNSREEALLRNAAYQKKICAVIATVCSSYLSNCQIT